MNIFIAGCGRSGTTLLLRLMRNFEDTHVHLKEAHYTKFAEMPEGHANYVVKRTGYSYKTLSELPAEIGLIYVVRDPLDSMTSHHRRMPERKFYLTPRRWVDEYMALRKLREAQPDRNVVIARYEDLVEDPDAMQQRFVEAFGLRPSEAFSAGERMKPSRESWRRNEEKRVYLSKLSPTFMKYAVKFCREFGYGNPRERLADAQAAVEARQSA